MADRRASEAAVMAALADGGEMHTGQLGAAAGLKPGTAVPILARMEAAGVLTSRVEPSPDRPARRYYRLARPDLEGVQ